MKKSKNLLQQLWNSKKDSYSDCKNPILQKTIDQIKTTYIQLTAQIEKGYYKVIDMDLPLQRRKTNHLMKKLYPNQCTI